MRRSKLESYEAILEALLRKPLNIDKLAFKAKMDCAAVNRYLDFLIRNGLVEERMVDNKTLYALTERGVTVFKTLNFQKYLEKISTTLLAIDEAIQAIPIISKSDKDQEKM